MGTLSGTVGKGRHATAVVVRGTWYCVGSFACWWWPSQRVSPAVGPQTLTWCGARLWSGVCVCGVGAWAGLGVQGWHDVRQVRENWAPRVRVHARHHLPSVRPTRSLCEGLQVCVRVCVSIVCPRRWWFVCSLCDDRLLLARAAPVAAKVSMQRCYRCQQVSAPRPRPRGDASLCLIVRPCVRALSPPAFAALVVVCRLGTLLAIALWRPCNSRLHRT